MKPPPSTSDCAWKSDWPDTRRRIVDWWRGEGLVLGAWYGLRRAPDEPEQTLEAPASIRDRYLDPDFRARINHERLEQTDFVLDTLPIAETNIGPGALAFVLGASPEFSPEAVWTRPCFDGVDPSNIPRLVFDEENVWWRTMAAVVRTCSEMGCSKYMTGCPDLSANLDVIASLRGTQSMLVDLVDRPRWVEQKIREIHDAWAEAYLRIYEVIRLSDGGSATDDFRLWGPGRTAMIQCDAAAMISPAMFERFVAPALRAQCSVLDFAMYHLDGPDSLRHLDTILGIEELTAVEWTPGPRLPSCGSPSWHELYRKILGAGKALQVVDLKVPEVGPLLEAVGANGVYIVLTEIRDDRDVEVLEETRAVYS